MGEWYVPITVLPGICLLILSTSNIMIDLSREVNLLIVKKERVVLIERKLKQLKLINRAMVFLYIAVASFVVSGLLAGVAENLKINAQFSIYMLLMGMFFALLALSSLMLYSFRAVKLRQDQYHDKC